MAKLKVFRTAIGFHDAYVAAPSMKAALAAWGTTKDLFARGSAEIVTDPALCREPLAHPGQIFKLSRGSAAEQIAALPKEKPGRAARADSAAVPPPAKPAKMTKLAKPAAPRPDRASLDRAGTAVRDAGVRQQRALSALDAQIARLDKQRRALHAAGERENARLEKARSREEDRYQRSMARWRLTRS